MEKINFIETENSTAIQRYVCEPMLALQRVNLSDDDVNMLNELLSFPSGDEYKDHNQQPYMVQRVAKRIKVIHTFKTVDWGLIYFIAHFCKLEKYVQLMLWYLQYWAYRNHTPEITLETFKNEILNEGWFTDDDLDKIWENQKVNISCTLFSENLVDYSLAGVSIKEI